MFLVYELMHSKLLLFFSNLVLQTFSRIFWAIKTFFERTAGITSNNDLIFMFSSVFSFQLNGE